MGWIRFSKLSHRWRIKNDRQFRDMALTSLVGGDARNRYPDTFRKVQRKPQWRKTAHKEVTQINIRKILSRYRADGWVLYRLTRPQVDRAARERAKEAAEIEIRQYIAALETAKTEMSAVKETNKKLMKETSTLKSRLDQIQEHLNQDRKHLLNSVMCNRRSIDDIRSITAICGVYFLWQNDTIVYIGMSKHIGNRLRSHASEKISFFDHFSFLQTENDVEAANLERLFIANNDPKFNKTYRKNTGVTWLLNLKHGLFENEVA